MASPAPTGFIVTQGNGQVYLQWNTIASAFSYQVYRSLDGISYVTIAQPTLNNYLDTAVTVGTSYWYSVASANVNPVYSTATLTFSGQPAALDTFTIANVLFQAVAAAPTGNQFLIGGTLAQTITSLVSVINSSPNLTQVLTATSAGNIVTFQAYQIGSEGNGLQFDASTLTNTTFTPFAGGITGVFGNRTTPQAIIPTMGGEMSLSELEIRVRQRADRVNSNFISVPELRSYINQSMYELYDLLITAYEDYFKAPNALFYSTGANQRLYPMPNGILPFLADDGSTTFVAPPIYKLLGIDMGLNVSNNGWVTVDKYNFADRNRFFYPNTASTIYGVFNCQYRWMGADLEFIPAPSARQPFRIQYIPRLPVLLQPTDLTTTSISGWLEYVITDAAIKVLQKEESDVSVLMAQKVALKQRIESSAVNKDAGRPDTISDVRGNEWWGGGHGSGGGNHGGF